MGRVWILSAVLFNLCSFGFGAPGDVIAKVNAYLDFTDSWASKAGVLELREARTTNALLPYEAFYVEPDPAGGYRERYMPALSIDLEYFLMRQQTGRTNGIRYRLEVLELTLGERRILPAFAELIGEEGNDLNFYTVDKAMGIYVAEDRSNRTLRLPMNRVRRTLAHRNLCREWVVWFARKVALASSEKAK